MDKIPVSAPSTQPPGIQESAPLIFTSVYIMIYNVTMTYNKSNYILEPMIRENKTWLMRDPEHPLWSFTMQWSDMTWYRALVYIADLLGNKDRTEIHGNLHILCTFWTTNDKWMFHCQLCRILSIWKHCMPLRGVLCRGLQGGKPFGTSLEGNSKWYSLVIQLDNGRSTVWIGCFSAGFDYKRAIVTDHFLQRSSQFCPVS